MEKKVISCARQALFFAGKNHKYYGDSAPSISMVKKWFTEFRCGRTSTIDAERPLEVAIPETIETSKEV